MFSSRLHGDFEPNAITRAIGVLRERQVQLVDLTETNPTMVGLPYPPEILAPLADPRGTTYAPEPFGLLSARAAVAEEASRLGRLIEPDRLLLTSSSSEAYSLLFKLMCDAGDVVLVPRPSYPLFESLAGLEAVKAAPYRLEYQGRWEIDRASLLEALTPRTRAVVVVTPNNPTGSMLRLGDREWLASLAAERNIAIISDEVFADYPLEPGPDASTFAGEMRALTFVLGGLSKSAGLPQVKFGWVSVSGPYQFVLPALTRLEVIADTYLSVSTSVQLAVPALLTVGREIRAAIQQRILHNLETLHRLVLPGSVVSLLPPEGGWSAVLRVPATESEEALVLRLLHDVNVLVHPGFFFDFSTEAYLVVSLLPDPVVFDEAMGRVLAAIENGPRP